MSRFCDGLFFEGDGPGANYWGKGDLFAVDGAHVDGDREEDGGA